MEIELKLKEAALTGNTQDFLEIHRNNLLLLYQFTVNPPTETPLHVALLRGHFILAEEIIGLCPDLAESLDSSRSSPLHLAAAKGCLKIVKLLVDTRPEMCTSLNRFGLSPVHLAVIKGRVEVVKELVQGRREATQAKTDKGENVLHLCVKHCQFEILKVLMESVDEVDQALISGEDDYGNTILPLAVADKQTKMVSYLLTNEKVNINANHANGYTPLDVLSQSRRDVQDWEIDNNALQVAGAVKAAHITKASEDENSPQTPSLVKSQNEWLSKKRDALMVVASLLAAMAFQAGVNPPGGVWQDDTLDPLKPKPHRAGEAILAYNYPDTYKFYLQANTISIGASLSTLLFLISGLPFKQRIFMLVLTGIMWLSITSMAFTYGFSVVAVTPKKDRESLRHTMYVATPLWCGIMVLLCLGHTLNIIKRWLKKKGIDMWDHMKICCDSSKGMKKKKANEVPNV